MSESQVTLSPSQDPLASSYDVALLDLDGVVYIGPEAVPGAPAALERARAAGMRLAFVTNNAARPPSVVADHLSGLGVPARPDEVITSSQAAAHYLAERLEAGAPVLVIGARGLVEALVERGLRPVTSADDDPVAVVQGYSPDADWRMLAEGCVAIRQGALWVATNLDVTIPSPRGPLPGNGAMVAALQRATGVVPVSTGKPDPTMHRETLERSAARRPIVVGDRLDTDIEGANAVGCASLLVLTGVTGPSDLLRASVARRPTYVAADLAGLLDPHPAVVEGPKGVATCNGWTAASGDGGLRLGGSGSALDALRALCGAAWQTRTPAADERGDPGTTAGPEGSGTSVVGLDAAARAVIAELGLR